MPLLLLVLRLQVELVFRLRYRYFFENKSPSGSTEYAGSGTKVPDGQEPEHVRISLMMMNSCITELLDPNLFYSRISFLESGKDGIDIKYELGRGKAVGPAKLKLPSITKSFFTRSSLVRNLFETSTDGGVRKRFSDSLSNFKASLKAQQQLEKTLRIAR